MARVIPKSSKPNAKGRNEKSNERFVQLTDSILRSPAYRSLSVNARALLVELIWLFDGSNNGALWLSVRCAAARIGRIDTKAVANAFTELVEVGFIALTKGSYFSIKASDTSRARCWRLTWIYDYANKKPATFDFKTFVPKAGSASAKRMENGLLLLKKYRKEQSENKTPVVDSTTMDPVCSPGDHDAVQESATANHENGAKPSTAGVVETATHIDVTIGSSAIYHPQFQWWGDGALTYAVGARLILLCLQLAWLGDGTTSLECAA